MKLILRRRKKSSPWTNREVMDGVRRLEERKLIASYWYLNIRKPAIQNQRQCKVEGGARTIERVLATSTEHAIALEIAIQNNVTTSYTLNQKSTLVTAHMESSKSGNIQAT